MLVDPSVLWMVEQYPSVDISPSGDLVEVTMLVNGQRWLGRLLLRLGSHARVVEPQEWTSVGAQTADRVLEVYRRAR
jgi:predicted DNA-binding transcriptional regulator YafY